MSLFIVDKLGLTDLRLVSPPTVWVGVATPVTFDLSLSCVAQGSACNTGTGQVRPPSLSLQCGVGSHYFSNVVWGFADINAFTLHRSTFK